MTPPPAPDADGFMRDVLAEFDDMRQHGRSGSITVHFARGQVQKAEHLHTIRRQQGPDDPPLPHPLP